MQRPFFRHPRFLSPVAALALLVSLGGNALSQQSLNGQIALLRQLDEGGEYLSALEILRPLLRDYPDECNLRCLAAEVLTDRSAALCASGAGREAKPLCEEAVSHARRATEIDPSEAEGWFQLGQSLGILSQLPGGLETAGYARESRAAFEEALAREQDHVPAIHGLARWHREVANLSSFKKLAAKLFCSGLPTASNEEAILLFERAIQLDPESLIHHLELGRTWLMMKEKERARAAFEAVMRMPARSPPELAMKEEAARLLAALRGSLSGEPATASSAPRGS